MALSLLGVVLLYTYITLAGLFVVCAMMTAYDHLLSVSTAGMVFYGVLWLWIPAISVFCRHLLLGYMIININHKHGYDGILI